MKTIFSNCDKCGKNIQYGKPHVSFTKNVEYAEHVSQRNRTEIQVIDSVQILTLCEPCGEVFYFNIISKIANEFSQNNFSENEN